MAPGPRRNCYTIYRPWYCAGLLFPPTRPSFCRGCGDRGCLTGDHLTIDVLRYPGSAFRPGDPDGAVLLRSSLLINTYRRGLRTAGTALLRTAGDANCSVACDSATLRQPAPSPVLRLLWLRTPLPNFPERAPAADAFTEVLLTRLHCWVLLTAAPDHCGPPGPVVSPVAVLQQPWLRNSTTAPSCALQLRVLLPAVRFCQALLSLWATRETITTPPPNVYYGRHRFPRV